jgi:phage shock protein A
MGVLSRVKRLVKANINEMLEKAEDPEKTLKQCIREMEESLAETRTKVADAVASQKLLAHKAAKEKSEVDTWEKRAVLALQKKDEELAREAVGKKRTHEITADNLTVEEGKQEETVQILTTTLAALEAKLDEAKQKRDILIARRKQAQTRKEMLDDLQGVAGTGSNVDTSAFEAFEKVEDRILTLEAEVETREEMGKVAPGKPFQAAVPTAEQKFKEMEAEDYINKELERLRVKARASGQ